MPATPDPLPHSVDDCDRELASASSALPKMNARSRKLTWARIDRLLDRRLLLTCDAKADELIVA